MGYLNSKEGVLPSNDIDIGGDCVLYEGSEGCLSYPACSANCIIYQLSNGNSRIESCCTEDADESRLEIF